MVDSRQPHACRTHCRRAAAAAATAGFTIPRAQTMVVKSPNRKSPKSRLGQSPASFIRIKMLSIVSTNSWGQMKPQFSLESMHSIHQKSSLMTAFNFVLLSFPEAKCLMVVLLEFECRGNLPLWKLLNSFNIDSIAEGIVWSLVLD